jgi:uncharacterized repeat protein (TIGR01451 family)
MAIGCFFICSRAHGQIWILSISGSNAVLVNARFTYNMGLTNQSNFLLQNVFVTNTLPAPAQFLGATSSQGSILSNAPQNVIFRLGSLAPAGFAVMTVTVQPTAAGSITSSVSAASLSARTNVLTTNLVTKVLPAETDLSVSLTGPAVAVYSNDWMSYQVRVANLGPSTATGVVLSNSLPAGVGLISLTPTNQSSTNGSLVLNLETLTNGESRSFNLRVQPTNSGVMSFSAAVSSAQLTDANPVNDIAATNIVVNRFLPGLLTASSASAMTYNPQTGLMEQKVRIANIGTSAVASARLMVSGLTNWLYNTVGTNNGHPFVVYNGPLDLGQNVDLTLEYFVPTRLPISIPDTAYAAVEVAAANVVPLAGTPFSVTLVTNVAPGAILIEFQSIPGRSYTIEYSDSLGFTNALSAQPPITAPADRVQWIDDGPPETISAPTTGSRFYRVILNP